MSLAGFVYAVGFGMMGFVNKFYLFLISGFVYTIAEILEATNSGVYIANHSPITHRGRFNAIIPLVTGLGFTFGPYIFGRIIDRYGLTNLWIFCFVLETVSGIFMAWLATFEVKMHSERESI